MKKEQYVPQFQVRSHIRSGEGGGYAGGTWYPDRSGVCGGFNPPPVSSPNPTPPTTPGGYVGGVWVADRSGACG